MIQRNATLITLNDKWPVLEVCPEPDLVLLIIRHLKKRRIDRWNNEQEKQKREVIKRKNSQNAAGIEVFKIIFRCKRIQKNIGDEKAGEYKKKVNTKPTVIKIFNEVEVVIQNYKNNCYSSQSIKSGIMGSLKRSRVLGY